MIDGNVMGFATHTQIRGRAELGQEWLTILTELNRRGALTAVGAGALLDLGQHCAGASAPRPPAEAMLAVTVRGQAPAGSGDHDA